MKPLELSTITTNTKRSVYIKMPPLKKFNCRLCDITAVVEFKDQEYCKECLQRSFPSAPIKKYKQVYKNNYKRK